MRFSLRCVSLEPFFVRSFANPQQLSLIYAAQFGSYGATSLSEAVGWRQCGNGKMGLDATSPRGPGEITVGISPKPNSIP